MDFPQLTMTLPDGREESIMKRTTLVRSHPRIPTCRRGKLTWQVTSRCSFHKRRALPSRAGVVSDSPRQVCCE